MKNFDAGKEFFLIDSDNLSKVETKLYGYSVQESGIYLYQQDGYFALSNSFFRLLEYLKTRFPLSLNRDYANHILSESLVNSIAYSETPIQEIMLLDKDAIVVIDMQNKMFTLKMQDYVLIDAAIRC